jgi:ADP-ribose pyrophosphatase YjhB (NUDIX family)
VQRADSKIWLYPTGWADVGYSPSEVAVKEVLEETGIECEARRLIAVIDGQRMGFSRFGMYMLIFHCHAIGGELQCHPLECADVGWFGRDALPEKTAGVSWWKELAFAAIDGKDFPTIYDEVRTPIWRS